MFFDMEYSLKRSYFFEKTISKSYYYKLRSTGLFFERLYSYEGKVFSRVLISK